MADTPCPRNDNHEPHSWLAPEGTFEWCPGDDKNVVVNATHMLDTGVPLEMVVETAITMLAITAKNGDVELDWARTRVARRTTEFTFTSVEDRARPIEVLVFDVPGVRR